MEEVHGEAALEQLEQVGSALKEAGINMKALSNAIKLSYDIQKLCRRKVSIAIDDDCKTRGEQNRKDTKRFMDKFVPLWETDVLRKARAVLCDRKLGVTPKMPDPKDILTLSNYLIKARCPTLQSN